ncbi:MAG: TVP38/TMEM64 family protein [Sandaracinaceae bacterium]
MSDEPEPESALERRVARERRVRWLRIGVLAALFVGSLIVAKLTGLSESVNVESVRDLMRESGPLGFLSFIGVFTIGELMHVPGLVFVGAASIAYGPLWGTVAGFVGAVTSVSVGFLVIRAIGGQPLGGFQRPILQRIFARLESHPIATVAILRIVFILAPALTYALAMSKVRFHHFVIGSALGLALPIPLAVYFFDYLAGWLLV